MKTHNRDSEERAANLEGRRRGSTLDSFLAGAATVLVLLALGLGGFLLYRAMRSGQISNPFNRQNNKNAPSVVQSIPASSASPSGSVAIAQNPYVQNSLDDKAQIELLSVTRVPEKPEEVNVQVRVRRLSDRFTGNETINLGATFARNPLNGERYEPVDAIKRSSGPLFLFNLRQNQTVDGYVVLKVPKDVKAIDIAIADTNPFKNVLVSNTNLITSAENGSSVNPSNQTPSTTAAPLPPTNSTPNNSANDGSSTLGKAPAATPNVIVEFQPGTFKQLAYGTKAEVELLSVKRIEDPQTGNRDVVNVQMRIRRLADKVGATDIIGIGQTTARNPVTSETYRAINPRQHSTGTVSLFDIRSGASADAYVWLKVPPGVNNLDIFIPETGAIKSVPVSN